jgi:hypothetical protein
MAGAIEIESAQGSPILEIGGLIQSVLTLRRGLGGGIMVATPPERVPAGSA